MLSKEDKINFVHDLLIDHPHLNELIFDENKKMRSIVRNSLLDISHFIIDRVSPFFTNFKVEDILLHGSICEYIWTDKSDIDLIIVINDNDEIFNKHVTNMLMSDTSKRGGEFRLYNHVIDIGFLKKCMIMGYYATYSILNNKWNVEPERLGFEYGAEELFYEYCKFSADLNRFVASLNKINGAFLDLNSCYKLKNRLIEIQTKAYKAKYDNPLHGYCKEYNIYRVAKRFGVLKHFENYVNDSYKYITGTEHARR